MNVSQLKASVRDNLQAGGGANANDALDPFWSNSEILRYVGLAIDQVWMAIKTDNEDYFMKIATTVFPQGVTEIALPSNFSELKLLEVTTDGLQDVVFHPLDMSDPKFRDFLQDDPSSEVDEYYFDIIGKNTLKVAPAIGAPLNMRLHYIAKLGEAREYNVGNVNVVNNSPGLVGVNTLWFSNVYKDWELIVGQVIDPIAVYPALISNPINNITAILNSGYAGATENNQTYILASPVDITKEARLAIEAYATMLAFAKGNSPNIARVQLWAGIYKDALTLVMGSLETRQMQDPTFVRPYDPWSVIR